MSGVEFNITVLDNMSATLDALAQKAEAVAKTLGETAQADEDLTKTREESTKASQEAEQAMIKQQLNAIGALTAINTLSSGVRLLSYSIIRLDFLSESSRQTVMKLVAAFQLLAGVSSIIKALTLGMEAMGAASLKVAIINTYNAVLQSPWKAAIAGIAMGAAAGFVGGMLLSGGGGQTTTETNYNIHYGTPNPNQDANNRIINSVIQGDRI